MGTQVSRDMGLSPKEFLGIDDKDLQKFLFINHHVHENYYFKKIDNDEKLGYYEIHATIRINQAGAFYPSNKITRWIVYHKDTKKLSTNVSTATSMHNTVVDFMMKDKFRYPELMAKFIPYMTGTLIKKIMTDKIRTVRDILKYHKSYTFKRKTLEPEMIYDAMLAGKEKYIHIFEDPENVNWKDNALNNIPSELLSYKVFKIKASEVDNVGERYRKWREIQGKKYAALPRRRSEETWSELDPNSPY